MSAWLVTRSFVEVNHRFTGSQVALRGTLSVTWNLLLRFTKQYHLHLVIFSNIYFNESICFPTTPLCSATCPSRLTTTTTTGANNASNVHHETPEVMMTNDSQQAEAAGPETTGDIPISTNPKTNTHLPTKLCRDMSS